MLYLQSKLSVCMYFVHFVYNTTVRSCLSQLAWLGFAGGGTGIGLGLGCERYQGVRCLCTRGREGGRCVS